MRDARYCEKKCLPLVASGLPVPMSKHDSLIEAAPTGFQDQKLVYWGHVYRGLTGGLMREYPSTFQDSASYKTLQEPTERIIPPVQMQCEDCIDRLWSANLEDEPGLDATACLVTGP